MSSATELAASVSIPFDAFNLDNGLRVVVHTDRKAPVVAVALWYDVGSKHEPAGRSGFAHLYEHLMFNGSENAPGDFFVPLKAMGATDINGSTNNDRTNYFETVPTAALERLLYLESDRMGYLTGAITQAVLDEQRGVVQNEKREGDNAPYGQFNEALLSNLFPAGHPYAHDAIGSMADLDAARLTTVKDWFRDHYGPNNAVLVLAGDIDVATARPLVEKYFGGIKRGKPSPLPVAPIPTLPMAKTITLTDRVAQVLISRNWAVAGLNDLDGQALQVAADVLDGPSAGRFRDQLVNKERLFTRFEVSNDQMSQVGLFTIMGLVREGVDPAVAARRMDAVIASFLKAGPTRDEVARTVTSRMVGRIRNLESVGGLGKASALGRGALLAGDPGFFKKQLDRIAAQTPQSVRAAADKWLARPTLAIDIVPGDRPTYVEAQAPSILPAAKPDQDRSAGRTRPPMPAIGPVASLAFPQVTRAVLSNGIPVIYAQRDAAPFTRLDISFDAGVAADVPGKLGTQSLMLSMLDEGVRGLSGKDFAEERDALGATISSGASADRTILSLATPSVNLSRSMRLFEKFVREPTFPNGELDRVKGQQIAAIDKDLTTPSALAGRLLMSVVLGPRSPYAKDRDDGDRAAVAALHRDDLVDFHRAWLRPDKAKLFIVSDRPLAEVMPLLEREFGNWKGIGPAGSKTVAPTQPPSPRILLIDRPGPQSYIAGGGSNRLKGRDDLLATIMSNDGLGSGFLSRINMVLREEKHWTYGANGNYRRNLLAVPYVVSTSVQTDKTGASLSELRRIIGEYVTAKPMTEREFDQAIASAVGTLPGRYETSSAVLDAMEANDRFGRPDDYYSKISTYYRALTLPQLREAARIAINPAGFSWVVVGDAKTIRSQLVGIGLPIQEVTVDRIAKGGIFDFSNNATAAK